jgi:hypothetical protein
LLIARNVDPEKQPLLANGSERTFVSMQRLGKYILAAADIKQEQKYSWKWSFVLVPCKGIIRRTTEATSDKANPDRRNIRGLNLAAVKPTTVQLTN